MSNQSAAIPNKKIDVRKMTLTAILSAIAAVVMLFEFPLPFAPAFYKLDLSEIIVLIGGYALGPVAAIVIELLKVIINTLFNGTTTAYVGEIANFTVGCMFVVPASIIYRVNQTKKGALIGMIVGTVSLTVVACLANCYILLPAYSKLYGAPIEAFIGQGADINGAIHNMFTFIIFATAPFNLVKGIISSVITFVVYKRISPVLKGKK